MVAGQVQDLQGGEVVEGREDCEFVVGEEEGFETGEVAQLFGYYLKIAVVEVELDQLAELADGDGYVFQVGVEAEVKMSEGLQIA